MKRIHHPEAGLLELEFPSFAVEGRLEPGMIGYDPASPADADHIQTLILARAG